MLITAICEVTDTVSSSQRQQNISLLDQLLYWLQKQHNILSLLSFMAHCSACRQRMDAEAHV